MRDSNYLQEENLSGYGAGVIEQCGGRLVVAVSGATADVACRTLSPGLTCRWGKYTKVQFY